MITTDHTASTPVKNDQTRKNENLNSDTGYRQRTERFVDIDKKSDPKKAVWRIKFDLS